MTKQTTTFLRRIALPLASAAVAALVLPWSSASAGDTEAFSGYNTSAWAAPVKIELYEPTIPIPAEPQAELELAYTRVEAETGLARARGSWVWPGDPVGEGFKTLADGLGLPPEVGSQGYPFQVNSEHPSGEAEQSDEPAPGMVMRTSAGAEQAGAQVGYSPDGENAEPQPDDGGDAPEPPGAPGLPSDQLADFGSAVTGSAPAEQDARTPLLPPELAALVDFASYSSTSAAETSTSLVSTESRSVLSDVSLIGGLVVVEGVTAEMLTTSDGKRATAEGSRALGTMSIAGNEFTVGPDGVEAGGERAEIPGLPDDPAKALAALGLQLDVTKPREERQGDQASGLASGLVVEIDTTQLRSKLRDVPLDDIVGAIPDETGELKSVIGAVANLSPRIVLTLGNAGTATDTVQALAIPGVPLDTGPADAGAGATGGAAGSGGAGAAGGVPAGAPGAPTDAGAAAPSADGALTDAVPAGAGLPPLRSIPGVLLVGGIALATAAGTWLRRIGLLALGGAGTCAHGLDSGLPDLRKA